MFKKKVKDTNVSKGKKNTVMKLLGSFCVAAALFGVLIGVEKNILSAYAKEPVVLCKTDIPKGTSITKDNVDQYFYAYEVDVAMLKEDCIRDKQELVGTVTNRDMTSHEMVRERFCTKEAAIYERYNNPVEASIEANEAGDMVSGTIRRGDYVDIAVVNKDTLEYELLMKKVYVVDAFTSTGERLDELTDGTAATMLTVVEDKGNLEKYYSLKEMGKVIVTRLDTEQ